MKKAAIVKARDRFSRAKSAAAKLDQDISLAEKQSAWSEFLVTTNTVFLMLEQGAQGHGKSEAWYARLNRTRRLDPLLQYLQQARHAEEHTLYEGPGGLGRVDGIHHPSGIFMGSILEEGQEPVGVASLHVYDLASGDLLPDNGGFIAGVSKTTLWLNKVKNRGREYDVPDRHEGKDIVATPESFASLALGFVAKTLADAEALEAHS